MAGKNREARDIHGPQVVSCLKERFGFRVTDLSQPRVVVAEVGVFKGELSEYLLEQLGNIHLLMIDGWELFEPPAEYVASGDGCATMPRSKMREVRELAESRTAMYADRRTIIQMASLEAVRKIGNVDAAFIDADHTYSAVLEDVRHYHAILNQGGLLFGHDYGAPRDRRGVWGVGKAVNEFAARKDLTVKTGNGRVWWYE